MPYIDKNSRGKFDEFLNQINKIDTKGELEYCLYKLMTIYMKDKEFKYSVLHDCTYGCIHAGDEFRRRNLDVRENEAREKNGDIL